MIKDVYWSSCKVPPFFSEFNVTGNFSTDYRKILKYQLSYKSVQRESKLFHAGRHKDGQTWWCQ